MSAKKIKSPSHKCFPTTRGHEIKIISKIDCFINSNAKMTQSCKQQVEHQTDLNQNKTVSIKAQNKNSQNADKEALINQLLLKNLKLKEEGDKKNKLIEMLIDDRTEIKRVTSLHLPQDKDNQQSKSNFRLQSPNHMEFTFYKSPNKGLPKEFQITPSKKMFF
ncbi:unnamed protein product (macronuclear) [Paramecium tetraurelia]|uniref:Uncharacterized protein n=1 Tax=Paramecium tetraurelia TaxID=5888 RepID=A0CDR7_PARTE|nr:uncharacterized protein GSPATT00007146001 [Paramecium tetraurelia]CAK68934.1 unnamed protein product [Paramecium tetraurelia]|eukprot:XP_001436331.1 hypothetical protein (macronuclear) [Paramecium tetraurelia strain d4-2]